MNKLLLQLPVALDAALYGTPQTNAGSKKLQRKLSAMND
jgi:hypothetical protein